MNLNTGLLFFLNPTYEGTAIEFIALFAVLLISYMLGSVNGAVIISRLIYKEDIRTKGSGNAGMTNMLRTWGSRAALLTLAVDVLKTALPIFITGSVFGFCYVAANCTQPYCYVSGLMAVLGHVFPLWFKFKGGKGVLATATMTLVLSPVPFVILFSLFAGVVALSKYVSLGSICSAMLLPVLVHGYFKAIYGAQPHGLVTLSLVIIAVLVVWCHRENIVRISERRENKLSFGKKKKEDE